MANMGLRCNNYYMETKSKHYYIYVLHCADESLYCGFTTNVQKRFNTHQSYKGAKYTRVKSRHPLRLMYWCEYPTKHKALSAEYSFKHQSRRQKERYLHIRGIKI